MGNGVLLVIHRNSQSLSAISCRERYIQRIIGGIILICVAFYLTAIDLNGFGCSGIAEKKVSDLKNRVLRTNQAPNAVLLSVHQNFFTEAKYRGAQVFYAKTDGSRELAEAMQAALRAGVDQDNHRQAKPSQGVYLMEHVNGTAVLVECGFLSNAAETALLQDEGYQQRLSAAVCGALTEWLEGRGTEDEV